MSVTEGARFMSLSSYVPELRDSESVSFSEDPNTVHQYCTSIITLASERSEAFDNEADEAENDEDIDYDDNLDEAVDPFHRRFSRLIVKTCRERLGEYCVRVSCTAIVGLALLLCIVIVVVGVIKIVIAIMYWQSCPASSRLPAYLAVSGLSPALFYVTCRTRRKEKGKTPQGQRILGRWRFSAFPCTLDTQRSWQAGLSGVLSFFLLCWLVYGSVLVALTSRRMKEQAALCYHPVAEQLSNGNDTSAHPHRPSLSLLRNMSSLTPTSSSLRSPPSRDGENEKNDTTLTPESSLFSSLSSSSASPSSSSNSSVSSTQTPLVLSSTNSSSPSSVSLPSLSARNPKRNSPMNHSASLAVDDSNTSDDEEEGSDEVIMTSRHGEGCVVRCDDGFLTWCWSLVLFDWLYLAAVTINVLVVGIVPCCCYVGMDV